MNVRIFDVDGTLTDNGHRRHLKGLPYINARDKDTVDHVLLDRLIGDRQNAHYTYVVTGRDGGLADETRRLLRDAAERLYKGVVHPDAQFLGVMSFRPGGNDGPPIKGEKVSRIITLANLHSAAPDDLLLTPTTVDIFDDEREVIDGVLAAFRAGALYAQSLTTHEVMYVGDTRAEVVKHTYNR